MPPARRRRQAITERTISEAWNGSSILEIGKESDVAGPCPAAGGLVQRGCQLFAQEHAGPHWHCGPQAQACCAAGCAGAAWQPQVQPVPGQAVQVQANWVAVFMAFLLSVG